MAICLHIVCALENYLKEHVNLLQKCMKNSNSNSNNNDKQDLYQCKFHIDQIYFFLKRTYIINPTPLQSIGSYFAALLFLFSPSKLEDPYLCWRGSYLTYYRY